jgi:hypothetical protein
MKNFHSVANQLEITIDEILEILDLTVEDAKESADLHPEEIIESLIDNGLDIYGDDDWGHGDSCSNFIDA